MTITLCGSIKFMGNMIEIQKQLEKMGHLVLVPIKAGGLITGRKMAAAALRPKRSLVLLVSI